MLRTRILSAATTAFLMIALSLVGAGPAIAVVDDSTAPVAVDLTPQPPADSGAEMQATGVDAPSGADEMPMLIADSPCAGDDCDQPARDCVVAIWQMPSWVDQWTPTWPQSFVSVHPSDCSTTQIDAAEFPVPATCDTQYQLDRYYVSEKTTALLAGGVLQGHGPEEDLVPGTWGTLVHNPECEIDGETVTLADAQFVPADCDSAPGSVVVTNGDGVVWTINDAVVAGNSSHDLARGEASVVKASLEATVDPTGGNWAWSDPEQQTEWTYTPADDQGCVAGVESSAPRLAATGPATSAGWVGIIAVLMTLTGAVVGIGRQRFAA